MEPQPLDCVLIETLKADLAVAKERIAHLEQMITTQDKILEAYETKIHFAKNWLLKAYADTGDDAFLRAMNELNIHIKPKELNDGN